MSTTLAGPRSQFLEVRVFGSVWWHGFHAGSDLDLAVEGLPPEAQLEALAPAQRLRHLGTNLAVERRRL